MQGCQYARACMLPWQRNLCHADSEGPPRAKDPPLDPKWHTAGTSVSTCWTDRQVDNGDVARGHAEGHAGEDTIEFRQHLAHGFGCTGAGGDDVEAGAAPAAPVLDRRPVDDLQRQRQGSLLGLRSGSGPRAGQGSESRVRARVRVKGEGFGQSQATSTTCCVAVTACTVDIRPCLMPYVSWITWPARERDS